MRPLGTLLAIASCSLLLACSAVERGAAVRADAGSAVTIEAAVSPLKSLLLLAPVATCTGCGTSFMALPPDVTIDPADIMSYLTDWKDYEVSLVPQDDETDILVNDLAAWHEHLEKDEPLPPALRVRLEALARTRTGQTEESRPGVLVIHSHVRYITATDLALYFMIVGMPNQFRKMTERNTSIALYDPGRGELIWERFFSFSPPDSMNGASTGVSLHERVMREMENLPAAARSSPGNAGNDRP